MLKKPVTAFTRYSTPAIRAVFLVEFIPFSPLRMNPMGSCGAFRKLLQNARTNGAGLKEEPRHEPGCWYFCQVTGLAPPIINITRLSAIRRLNSRISKGASYSDLLPRGGGRR